MAYEGGLRFHNIRKQSQPGLPLISVITVVFNGDKTLELTIQSVITQTYKNVEYIVIDGGSTDSTLSIVRKYENNIDYWVSEQDFGIYDAMNKGIAICSGEYVGMLNSDDFFSSENSLQEIADRFCNLKVDAVFACLNIVDKNNLEKIIRKYRVAKLSSALLRIGVMPAHPTFYCKRSCYVAGGMYKTDYKIVADFEMLTRLFLKQKITWSFLNKVTVIMCAGGVSSRGLKSSIILNLEILRACKENGLYTNLFFLALKIPFRLFEKIR